VNARAVVVRAAGDRTSVARAAAPRFAVARTAVVRAAVPVLLLLAPLLLELL
jgi:hypothetical protein